MFRRVLADKVLSLAKQFPVVFITGPRQSGKTTLAKTTFGAYEYVSLEDPDSRDFARRDPVGFLKRYSRSVIFDEVQNVPDLLSVMQLRVDEDSTPGRFILTGSQQLPLTRSISQTLAGRVAVCVLLPLSMEELTGIPAGDPWNVGSSATPSPKPSFSLEWLLHQGLYPRVHDKALTAYDWLASYYTTYIERDVRDFARIGDLETFQRFVRLCAGRSGSLLNLSSLAADCGISHTTARSWISTLQATFVVHLLPPHHANFSKRLMKSPKLYFYDCGLLCYLLRIRSHDDLVDHAMRGPVFETYVLSEVLKAFMHRGENPPVYFWHERTGREVDIIIDDGKKLLPMEVKSSRTITSELFKGLGYFTALGPPAASSGVLVYGGEEMYQREGFLVRPWYKCV